MVSPASTKDWTTDYRDSQVSVTARIAQQSVSARFHRFQAQARFDRARPAAGSLKLVLDADSIETGDSSLTAAAKSPEWLDTNHHPQAEFVTERIEKDSDSRFKATGALTIKGISKTVTIPFSLQRKKDTWTIHGQFSISRTDFSIGGQGNAPLIDNNMDVHFRLRLGP